MGIRVDLDVPQTRGLDGADFAWELKVKRQARGFSQRELASLTGVSQSNIAALESGKRHASPTMQERLLRPLQEKPRETLKRNLDKVRAFLDCAHVTHPRVFGSVAQGEDRVDSDIDFLVVLPEGIGLMGKNRIREGLEDILGVPVDVVSDTPFTAGALDQARSEAVELGRIA